MTNFVRTPCFWVFAMSLLLSACGGGGGGESANATPTEPTEAEVVINQPESTPRQGEQVEVQASTRGFSGDIDSIAWRQTAGPSVALEGADTLTLRFTPVASDTIEPDEYAFELTVADSAGNRQVQRVRLKAHRRMSARQASRLLQQATMGPTGLELQTAQEQSEHEWLTVQMAMPMTSHAALLENYPGNDEPNYVNRIDAWWKATLTAPDQLRQRVAFALSEILVVSDSNNALRGEPEGMVDYYDILLAHAFGNYRELLEAVTLSPVMGVYLSHLGNEGPDEERNIRPDENYAREVMQLFSIGLNELNLDGSNKTDAQGQAIPTYGQTEIEGFAHVFTGWTFGASARWNRPSRNYTLPMEPWEDYHSPLEKHLLIGEVLPEGQDARSDLEQALDNIFAHPNVAPFISKQLIQRLITSNPTPQYVERVASVFNDNGEGVKGDLAAVVRAIYLDDEARQQSGVIDYVGKIREPLLRTTHMWREMQAASLGGWYFTWSLDNSHGQSPLGSPSVFNFFRPDYQPADLLEQDLVAPELQIANDAALIGQFNEQYANMLWRIKETSNTTNENQILLSFQQHVDILELQGVNALLDYYEGVFFSGRMSAEMRATLREVQDIWSSSSSYQQVAYMLFTVSVSPDYIVQL